MADDHKRFGRYELVTAIGRGGMAELYLGRLLGVGGFAKPVAIKRILPHLTEDSRFVEMFLNEGRIAARLTHPNVCQVFELGEVDGELFLAMEYLEGVPWSELLASVPREPVAVLQLAAHVIGQACDGLSYAHELRGPSGEPTPVVHRDVSPGNLFVTVDGVCKVLDFGVSKFVTDLHDTRSGLIKGKLMYMPPEQMRSEHVDARADVFAAGVVLWEALAGKRLFARDTDYLIFRAILDDPIPPLADSDPTYVRFDGALDAVIGRALERDRDRRTPTIRVFADELRAVAARFGEPVTSAQVGALVRSSFQPRLAERARKVAVVTAIYEELDTEVQPRATTATASVKLRTGGSRAVERPRRRRGWAVAIITGTLLAAIVAIAPWSGGAVEVGARGSGIDASQANAALVDADVAVSWVATTEADARDVGGDTPPPPRPRHDPDPARPAKPKPGYYSVDSDPFATIYIDGKRKDHTPLYRVELSPGKHEIRAVLDDKRQRMFTVSIESGKEVSSHKLSW